MIELLLVELAQTRLTLNSDKTKILHTSFPDRFYQIDLVEIAGEMIEVLRAGVSHRYLGRMLNLDKEVRV